MTTGVDEQETRSLSLLTVAVAVAVAGAAAVGAALHWAAMSEGARRVVAADGEWLAVAAAVVCLTWVSGTSMQMGVVSVRPPVLRLFAVQVAGSFMNHLLPAGFGGLAVNVRFLRRLGMTREAALASQALNASAGAVTHLALFAIAWAFAPAALRDAASAGFDRVENLVLTGVAVALVLGVVLVVTRRVHGRGPGPVARLTAGAVAEYRALAAVTGDPRRAAQLWSGALALPVVHTLVLFAVLNAVGTPLPIGVVLPVYLGASAVSSVIPSPGGAGSLDVALAAALVLAGLPVTAAVGALVAYRFLTVWVPFLPGACTLGVLLKRRIV